MMELTEEERRDLAEKTQAQFNDSVRASFDALFVVLEELSRLIKEIDLLTNPRESLSCRSS